MVSIDTAINVLKNTYHLDTYLEFMCTRSGVKDVIITSFQKTRDLKRKDFRAITRISIVLDNSPLERLLEVPDFNSEKYSLIADLVASSFQFYQASDVVDFVARPVLLFYAMEHLAAASVFSRYKIKTNRRKRHGITQNGYSDYVLIQKDGFYPLFVYSHNSTLQIPSNQVNYKFLLNAYFTASNQRDSSLKRLAEREYGLNSQLQLEYKKSKIDELNTHYLLMFYFSSLSRYQIRFWKEKLSGKNTESFLIKKFIEQSRENFPTWLFYKCFRS